MCAAGAASSVVALTSLRLPRNRVQAPHPQRVGSLPGSASGGTTSPGQLSGAGQEGANIRGTDESGTVGHQLDRGDAEAPAIRPRLDGADGHTQEPAIFAEADHGALREELIGTQWLCHTANRSIIWLRCTAKRECV